MGGDGPLATKAIKAPYCFRCQCRARTQWILVNLYKTAASQPHRNFRSLAAVSRCSAKHQNRATEHTRGIYWNSQQSNTVRQARSWSKVYSNLIFVCKFSLQSLEFITYGGCCGIHFNALPGSQLRPSITICFMKFSIDPLYWWWGWVEGFTSFPLNNCGFICVYSLLFANKTGNS